MTRVLTQPSPAGEGLLITVWLTWGTAGQQLSAADAQVVGWELRLAKYPYPVRSSVGPAQTPATRPRHLADLQQQSHGSRNILHSQIHQHACAAGGCCHDTPHNGVQRQVPSPNRLTFARQ